jgi:phosphoglycerate dehydrogenase-like enzyme
MRVLFPKMFAATLSGLTDGVELRELPAERPADLAEFTERFGEVPMLIVGSAEAAQVPWLVPALPGLRVVQTVSAGYDWILPLLPAGAAGRTLCRAVGVHDHPVAEWFVTAMLTVRRRFDAFGQAQRRHEWRARISDGLAGARVTILGYGEIGAAVERLLGPFGATIARVASRARPGVHGVGDLPALLPDTDVLVVTLPGGPATAHLVDGEVLAALPDGALVLNAGRGTVLDTDALLAQAGRIRAVLDVVDPEPLPPEHPLWDAPGVLITPHVASPTRASVRRISAFLADQIARVRDGREPLGQVADWP